MQEKAPVSWRGEVKDGSVEAVKACCFPFLHPLDVSVELIRSNAASQAVFRVPGDAPAFENVVHEGCLIAAIVLVGCGHSGEAASVLAEGAHLSRTFDRSRDR